MTESSMSGLNVTNGHIEDYQKAGWCEPPVHPLPILILTVVVGSCIALISCVENSMIVLTLSHDAKHYKSHFLYLLLLALWDCGVSLSYILLFPVDVMRDWMRLQWLSDVWLTYLPFVYAMGQFTSTLTTYFILVATFERFLIEAKSELMSELIRRNRVLVCVLAMLWSAVIKVPTIFELEVSKFGNCEGMREFGPRQTRLSKDPCYKYYSFYFRTFFADVLPFMLICVFNCYIAIKLRRLTKRARLFRMKTIDQFEEQANAASKTLAIMVMTYLLSKSFAFTLTVWEFLNIASLEAMPTFYAYSSQIASFLVLCGCALRLPVYLIFNPDIRKVMLKDTRRFFCCVRARQETDEKEQRNGDGCMFSNRTDEAEICTNSARTMIYGSVQEEEALQDYPVSDRSLRAFQSHSASARTPLVHTVLVNATVSTQNDQNMLVTRL